LVGGEVAFAGFEDGVCVLADKVALSAAWPGSADDGGLERCRLRTAVLDRSPPGITGRLSA